jgi:hypothetical protein
VDFSLPFTQEPGAGLNSCLGGSPGRPTLGKILGGSVDTATRDSVEPTQGLLLHLASERSEQKVSAHARRAWGAEIIEPLLFQVIESEFLKCSEVCPESLSCAPAKTHACTPYRQHPNVGGGRHIHACCAQVVKRVLLGVRNRCRGPSARPKAT